MNDEIKQIILNHYKKYPLMQLEDVFKLVYQNEFGGEHLIVNKESFIDNLKQEKNISSDFSQIEEIGNNLVRIDLSLIDDIEAFTNYFILSFNSFGNIESFINKINVVKGLISEEKLLFKIDDVNSLLEKMKEQKYAPISHSDIYKKMYNPHYRIINKKFLIK